MKNRKRNIALLAVVMCVCAAVLLNWSYNNRWGRADSKMAAVEDAEIAEANATMPGRVNSGYFDEARLTRQVSRDEALQLLQSAASADAASQETIDSAMNAFSAMATCSMQETQIENLLLAKDFSECVVYIGNGAVTVAVPAPIDGLSEEEVARITDIICTETEYDATLLNIIEVKA